MNFNYEIINLSQCNAKSKTSLFRQIAELINIQEMSRSSGLLEIEGYIESLTLSQYPIFTTCFKMIIDGCETDIIKKVFYNMIYTEKQRGLDLLRKLIIADGIISIQNGISPELMKIVLISYLGDSYITEFNKYFDSAECAEHMRCFAKKDWRLPEGLGKTNYISMFDTIGVKTELDDFFKLTAEISVWPDVKDHGLKYRAGDNTFIDDNNLISMINGDLVFNNDAINVNPIFTLKSNVDLDTGDIVYNGTIIIPGNVASGFSVKASGNIYILGKAEEGSIIEAEGEVVFINESCL